MSSVVKEVNPLKQGLKHISDWANKRLVGKLKK